MQESDNYTQRIPCLLTTAQKSDIERAAAHVGVKPSVFMRMEAVRSARAILMQMDAP